MPIAESDGLAIHYETSGDGLPVVLAHGWGASTESNWVTSGWVDALAAHRRVIGIDIRGHGSSDKPYDPEAYRYAAMAGDVIAVLDHLGIEFADFIGYSLGAFSGMHLLGHHADRIRAAVLIGIGDETPESASAAHDIAAALRAANPADLTSPLARAYRSYVDADPRNDREALAVSALTMWPDGFPRAIGGDALADLRVPVLVLNGEDDQPYVQSDQALVEAMGNAELVRIPGCDHLSGVHDQRFKDTAIEFLTR